MAKNKKIGIESLLNTTSGKVALIFVIALLPIALSWVAYFIKDTYKLPVNPNAAAILAGITGMLGSIIGGLFTLIGVYNTLKRQEKDYFNKELRKQSAAVVFLLIELEEMKQSIESFKQLRTENKDTIYKLDLGDGEELTITGDLRVKYDLIQNKNWDYYITQIQNINIQEDIWKLFNFVKRLNAAFVTDITKNAIATSKEYINIDSLNSELTGTPYKLMLLDMSLVVRQKQLAYKSLDSVELTTLIDLIVEKLRILKNQIEKIL